MRASKLVLAALAITLLAAGCSKKNQATTPPPAGQPITLANSVTEQAGWIRFVSSEKAKINVLMPEDWLVDSDSTDSHFIIRNRLGSDGTRPEDVFLEFNILPLTAQSVSAQVTADTKGAKDQTKALTGKTDVGLPYAMLTFTDVKINKYGAAYAVDLGNKQYLSVRSLGNVANPYVAKIVQSVVKSY